MKRLFFIQALFGLIIFSSCSEEDGGSDINDALLEQLDADAEAALESNYEDAEIIAEAGLASLETVGRIERDTVISCAIVTHDQENKTVTIDYGDECVIRGGRVLSGKIIVVYNERKLIPGAYRIVTFEDFYIDGVKVEGTRTWTNVAESLDENFTFNTTLEGGKLSFPDETTATRDANHTKEWLRANNPLNDEFHVIGSAEGSTRSDIRYEVEILEALVFKRGCRAQRVFIPVSGIKQITHGEDIAIINYGDGDCDNEVTITINGETFTKTIEPRGRRN